MPLAPTPHMAGLLCKEAFKDAIPAWPTVYQPSSTTHGDLSELTHKLLDELLDRQDGSS